MARSPKRQKAPPKPARKRPVAAAAAPCPCGQCGSDEALSRQHERWRRMLGLLGQRESRLYAAEKALELGASGAAVLARITGWPAAVIEEAMAVLEAGPAPAAPPAPKAEPEARPAETPERDLRSFQDWHEYERRLERPMMMKLAEFQRDGRLRHVLFSQQFDRGTLDRIGQITTKMRAIGETRRGPALPPRPAAPQARHALLHPGLDAHVPVVHRRLPDPRHHLQRNPRPVGVVRGQGRIAARLDPHVLQLLRHHHHAGPVSALRRGLRLPDERPRPHAATPTASATAACRSSTAAPAPTSIRRRRCSTSTPCSGSSASSRKRLVAAARASTRLRRKYRNLTRRPGPTSLTASAATSAAAARSARWPRCCRCTRA